MIKNEPSVTILFVMSKRNRQHQGHQTLIEATPEAEKQAVRKDMIQTVIVNLLFIGLLIGLNVWNQANGTPLDKLVGKFINL